MRERVHDARVLGAQLDLLVVRKIGLPWQPELAYAAVVDGNPPEVVVNEEVARYEPMSEDALAAATRREVAEIERRRALYKGRPLGAGRGGSRCDRGGRRPGDARTLPGNRVALPRFHQLEHAEVLRILSSVQAEGAPPRTV